MSMILPGLEGIKDSWIPLMFRISKDKQQQQPDPTSRLLPTASTHSTFYFRSQKAYTRLTMQFTTLITLLASRFVVAETCSVISTDNIPALLSMPCPVVEAGATLPLLASRNLPVQQLPTHGHPSTPSLRRTSRLA